MNFQRGPFSYCTLVQFLVKINKENKPTILLAWKENGNMSWKDFNEECERKMNVFNLSCERTSNVYLKKSCELGFTYGISSFKKFCLVTFISDKKNDFHPMSTLIGAKGYLWLRSTMDNELRVAVTNALSYYFYIKSPFENEELIKGDTKIALKKMRDIWGIIFHQTLVRFN